jgi:hypothetical protein
VKTGTDRYDDGYEGGTRHLCPFCEWYLDAEPLPREAATARGWQFMDAVSRRLQAVTEAIEDHMRTDHPIEYQMASRLDRIG